MAPSPAAGKSGSTPRTPTKLSRKPQSGTPSKLGQKGQSATSGDRKPSTPQAPKAEKPETESPEVSKDASDKAQDASKKTEEPSKVEMKDTSEAPSDAEEEVTGKVSQGAGDLEEQEPKPVDDEDDEDATGGATDDVEDDAEDAADDATEKAGDVGDDTEDAADDATEKAGDVGDDNEDTAGATGGAKNAAIKGASAAKKLGKGDASGARDEVTDDVDDDAEDAEDAADDVEDTAEDVDDTAEEDDAEDTAEATADDAKATAKDTADDAKDTAEDDAEDVAEDADGQDSLDTPDLSILKGLEVDEEGLIHDSEGNAIGKLVEGDAEDLAGFQIGDDGEILDDDGDLVGRCEILPEKAKELAEKANGDADDSAPKLPSLDILEGLTVGPDGLIYNDDGDTVGQLIEGDPSELQGKTVNDKGEILDDEGNVIGRAKIHEDAAALYDEEDDDADDDAKDAGEGVEDKAGDAIEGAEDDTGDAIDGELPGIEALDGRSINEEGQIVDGEGNVLGELAEGDLEAVKGMNINENGEVLDEEGNVIGKVELAEGAAEKIQKAAQIDLRILDGLKVNKKGKILDGEGEPIGELVDGEISDCAGKKCNDKGEVLDKEGNVVGRVKVVPGEAADEATKELHERLGEAEDEDEAEDEEPGTYLPGLEILDGLKVNKKGKIINEDGEEIGELVDGELSECAGKKANDKGEVLDTEGKVIGRVKTLRQEGEAAVEAAEDTNPDDGAEGDGEAEADGEAGGEDSGPQLPPLSILEGLKVNKAGKLIDSNGNVVGELVEGDAKKLSKSGTQCDAEGQFWDNKGHVIGRAQTIAPEEGDEEAEFAGLEGLIVNKDGMVEDENGNVVGKVVEGNAKKLVGRAVDEDGDIIDKKGSVVGHAERVEDVDEEPEEKADLSFLKGKTVNKQGNVIGDEGVPVARLVEGNPKELAGKKLDSDGQIWNEDGKVIGRVELIPENERESKPEGIFGGLQGLRVVADGMVADEDDNIVGRIVEGNAKRLLGLSVDEDGDIIDKYGNVKGHAEPLEEEDDEAPVDNSILENKVLNKQGFVVGDDGIPVGRLVEGDVKELAGRRCDDQGQIHNDTGKVVGRCEVIPENERVHKGEGPFSGLEGLHVVSGGFVEDEDGNTVGIVVEGNAKRLVGQKVDEDGDIIDKYGNVKGHADPYEEEEEAPVDLSSLEGCTVNKAGNIVDSSGTIRGRVAEGDLKNLIGRKVDGQGQIWDNGGKVIGRAELAKGEDTKSEGEFAGFDDITVQKDGTVTTAAGDIVGRVTEGDVKKLVGHKVDEEGDITDKNGNSIGKAERWEPEEKARKINPMSGMHVNKEGEVRDENGDLVGRLTAGDLGHCTGLEIDDNGYVIDNDGNKVGEVTLLENIAEEEEEDEDMTEEELQRKQDAELADKMANICQQTLERVQPVCKQITDYIEAADRTPREELDEEELVNNVKPLIEEGGRILQECNGSLRGLDPDGRIAAQAKGRSGTKEATPEEYRLADCLKELTTTVVTTIDNAKKKINDMPHAKKKLNPLWGLLTQPLFQIIAAVGLLLAGVLGLVGQLLSALGLGGLVNGLLGGLGIDKLLGGLGLGGITDSLGGKKKGKGGGGASSLPLVGGLFGGKK
ncbi:hypothetical protein EJ08DRAFT_625513 [Tothia fuscella]|uniref:DUF6987 domain-containing protein n=1 Tax=Tothia fuscella TaxID=1048955 RepID=A0A9P4U3E9_9PEZI|nr:hypothetical protein EJ08DRAFT_625513 [Tothia fuscella]